MRDRYIDFISAYCDRWCERCAFTDRCSAYAVHAAIAMCDGNVQAAMDLAIGTPREDTAAHPLVEEAIDAYANLDFSPEETARSQHERKALDEKLERDPIMAGSTKVLESARGWLAAHEADPPAEDAVVAEARLVVMWDCWFIRPKLHRALSSRAVEHDPVDDDPIQNDWNGSAKVALISIVRSGEAWDLIATATGDAGARLIADGLRDLRAQVEEAFPDAWKFVRPGFDTEAPSW